MREIEIFGVDFSGAKSDRQTWLARGVSDGVQLHLQDCRTISRAQLTDLLINIAGPTIAALDFPFSVPHSFARFWMPDATAMPDLWTGAQELSLDDFMALRNQFVAQHGEPKRLADTYHPESYSCLHLVNPNLVPMTFRGMQMLHQLWQAGCSVPPLPDELPDELDVAHRNGPLLLEVMPGAALKAFGLPYKGYKNGVRAGQLRRQILDQLSQASTVSIQGLAEMHDQCLASHDCLDAIVAAVVAALWHRDARLFRAPSPPGQTGYDPVTLLEGWLYAPVFLRRGQ